MNYATRKLDMTRMRKVEGKTLQEIANTYGVSRERVRQIIGNTGKDFRWIWTEKFIEKFGDIPSHWTELNHLPGVIKAWKKDWGNHRHIIVDEKCATGRGFQFEEKAHQLLNNIGIKNQLMPNHCAFDIQTSSGKRIDVKHSNFDVTSSPSHKKISTSIYPITHLKSGKDCDFFLVFIPDKDEPSGYSEFVIPSYEVFHLSKSSTIRISWPPTKRKSSRWHKYHKRFDLLESD